MTENELNLLRLETLIKELAALCERLSAEKGALQDKYDLWLTERARLIENKQEVRVRLEAMLKRLRILERCA